MKTDKRKIIKLKINLLFSILVHFYIPEKSPKLLLKLKNKQILFATVNKAIINI